MTQRTTQQNKALWKFFRLLSDKMNEQGLEMPMVLTVPIWWTPNEVHDRLWVPLQKKMYGTESTTQLEKIEQIDSVHEQLMQILGERVNVEYIDFPHDPAKISNSPSYHE